LKLLNSKYIQNSSLVRNSLTLFGGTGIAQLIPILVSPILTRIYTPSEFGTFAIFISLGSMASIPVTGKYDLAIILPKDRNRAIHLVVLAFGLTTIVSLLLMILIYIFHPLLQNFIHPDTLQYIYLIPLASFFIGCTEVYKNWSNRESKYKEIAISNVARSLTRELSTVSISVFYKSTLVLIAGTILGQIVSTLYFYFSNKTLVNFDILKSINFNNLKSVAKEYKKFPIVTVGHSFLNVFSAEVVIVVLAYFFTSITTGLYSLAKRAVLIPSALISGAVGRPFYEKLVFLKNNEPERVYSFLKKTIGLLMLISLVPSLVLVAFAPQLFGFVFGEEWIVAGTYTQILIPFFFIRFVGSIVSFVVLVFEKQGLAFKIELIQTVLRVVALIIGGVLKDVYLSLVLFSIVSFIVSGYRLWWYLSITKKVEYVV
jgi:O-antigen/teichoic acid export membrane protein